MSKGTPLSSLPRNNDEDEQPYRERDREPSPLPPPPQQQMRQQQVQEDFVPRRKTSITSMLYRELKYPVIVALLFFVLNLDFVNKHLTKLFPRLINESTGDLNYFGVGAKSVVMGFIYYLLKYFDT